MQNSKFFPWTKPQTFILGKRKFLFCFFQKCIKNHLQQCRIQKFSRGHYSGPRFKGEEFVFVIRKCTKTLPQHCIINKINSPGDNTPDLRFRDKSLFLFFENVPELCYSNADSPTAMQNSKISRRQYITLYYNHDLTLSVFRTSFTPRVTSGASTKLRTTVSIYQCKQMNSLLKVHLSVILRDKSKRKIIQYSGPRFREKESLFLFAKNVGYQNSRTAMQNFENIQG